MRAKFVPTDYLLHKMFTFTQDENRLIPAIRLASHSHPGHIHSVRPASNPSSEFHMPSNANASNVIFLAGSGRSGTTWLANLINHRQDHCYYFEPLNHHQVKGIEPFGWRQYLRPDGEYPEHYSVAKNFLYGTVDVPWVNRFNHAPTSSLRMVKEIRANMTLAWMRRRFPDVKIILTLRHPIAVTISRLEMGWTRGVDLVLGQSELNQDFLEPVLPLLEREGMHPYESGILLWCVENFVALQQIRELDVHVMFYEHLALNPECELKRLYEFLDRPFDEHILEGLDQPSHTSGKVDPARTAEARLEKWKKKLTPDIISRTVDLLKLFSLDQIYDDNATPRLENASVLSGQRIETGGH
jgi:Sulfotransferase domain